MLAFEHADDSDYVVADGDDDVDDDDYHVVDDGDYLCLYYSCWLSYDVGHRVCCWSTLWMPDEDVRYHRLTVVVACDDLWIDLLINFFFNLNYNCYF